MFCSNCGNKINENADVCLYCGSSLNNNISNYNKGENDKSNVGLNLISFFIPLIGLILYISLKKDTPIKAKGCGKSALFGFIVGIAISVILLIFVFMTTANSVNNQIEEARKKSLSNYSISMFDEAKYEYYLNNEQGEKCYNLSELDNYNEKYKGSIIIEQNGSSFDAKVWVTYDGLYSVTEYEKGIKVSEEVIESSNVNLTCKD